VNTDSHHLSHLDNMVYGVAQARRGWVGPEQVLNTLPLAGLERAFRH
jgi:DNA polymerase (family X)